MPWLNIMRQRTSKNADGFVLCWLSTFGIVKFPWWKLIIHVQVLSIGDSFWARDGVCVHFSFQLQDLIWWRSMQDLSSYVCLSWCIWKTLFPWYPPYPLTFTLFLASLPQNSLSPKGRELMETCHLGLSVPESLILCLTSGSGSPYLFPSAARGIVSHND